MKKSFAIVLTIITILALIAGVTVFYIFTISNKAGSSGMKKEAAIAKLDQLYNGLTVTELPLTKGDLTFADTSLADTLPSMNKYPLVVKPTTTKYIEILTSTEKGTVSSEAPKDKWLIETAEAFNKEGTVNGERVSVGVRNVTSGVAYDYIRSGVYIPDMWTPSNTLYGEALEAAGFPIYKYADRIVGNVAGVAIHKDAHSRLKSKYGDVTPETLDEAVIKGDLTFGYTNPLMSSTGINKLLSLLNYVDPTDPLSDKASAAFAKFQNNVPYTAYTTLQMLTSATAGKLEAFVTEAQQFANAKDMKDFIFIPFGVRHDSPAYIFDDSDSETKAILQAFLEFSATTKYQKLATDYGFNQYDSYIGDSKISGDILDDASSFWKEKKAGERDRVAVFVADTSGSMNGPAMNQLVKSLRLGMKYISETSAVGLVTFSDDASIALPLNRFDLNQMSHYAGAVESISAGGETAMYDGIIVAAKMLKDYEAQNPGVKPIMFVLTDGKANRGLTHNQVARCLEGLGIPINVIHYNGKHDNLDTLANLNEAASIVADEEDVVYKIGAFFNAEL